MMFILWTALLWSPWRFALAQRCSTQYSQTNFKLQGHVIKSLSRSESPQCVDECSLHGKCHSINFDHGKGICELNDANHLSNPESLVYSHGSQYLNYHKRPVANCSNKLCSEPLVCEMPNDGLDYKCRGFEVLNFPRKTIEDKVVLENAFNSLTAFTVALWVQADPSTDFHATFSYATRLTNSAVNEILFLPNRDPAETVVWLGGKVFSSIVNSIVDGKWHHLCITWENAQGKLKVYIDGVLVKSVDAVRIGHVISKGAIVLGQEQDSYNGGFDSTQSLQGNLTSVNMWDKVLAAQEISVLAKSCREGVGNIVKWSDLKDKGEGAVKLIRNSACN